MQWLVPALLAGAAACTRQPDEVATFNGAVRVWRDYRYLSFSPNQRLDFHVPVNQPARPPLVVHVHGGGWMTQQKEGAELAVAPYLAAGWAVANVEYRNGFEASAPAAGADVRCAIKWAARHADDVGVDASRLVLVGGSAGAHLVMLAAFADSTAGLDAPCPGAMPRVALVINWMGIADVNDLIQGPNERGWATGWVGQMPGAAERARQASPLRWVRAGLPAVLTLHGDQDATVPFAHAQRLHAALDSAGVPNELVVLAGADHGNFSIPHAGTAWSAVMRRLAQIGGAGTP